MRAIAQNFRLFNAPPNGDFEFVVDYMVEITGFQRDSIGPIVITPTEFALSPTQLVPLVINKIKAEVIANAASNGITITANEIRVNPYFA